MAGPGHQLGAYRLHRDGDEAKWRCIVCKFLNGEDAVQCTTCKEPKPSAEARASARAALAQARSKSHARSESAEAPDQRGRVKRQRNASPAPAAAARPGSIAAGGGVALGSARGGSGRARRGSGSGSGSGSSKRGVGRRGVGAGGSGSGSAGAGAGLSVGAGPGSGTRGGRGGGGVRQKNRGSSLAPMSNATTNATADFVLSANPLENAWRYLFATYPQRELLAVMSFAIHTVFYLVTAIPAFILPMFRCFDKYKIQKGRVMTKSDLWECVRVVAISQIFVEIPLYFVMSLYVQFTGMPTSWDELPANVLFTYAWKSYLSLVLEDAWHYWVHRLLHHPRIYGPIHKIHHMYNSPFTMTAEYAHPVETIVLGTGFIIPILLLSDHVLFMFVWLAVRIAETADVHSGYDLPFNPMRLMPFYGGARMHDAHHKLVVGNFGSSFTWWDHVFGTYVEDKQACVEVPADKPKLGSRADALARAEGAGPDTDASRKTQ